MNKDSSVLIVDDQISILNAVKRVFQDTGVEVFSLSDPRQVVSFLQQHPEISLVLTDINMPHLNGLELQRLIQQNFPNRAAMGMLRVKFMSGHSKEDLYQTLGVSVNDFIEKPFGLGDIRRLLSGEATAMTDLARKSLELKRDTPFKTEL